MTNTIKLNFLEITPQNIDFNVYRRPYQEDEMSESVYRYRLPEYLGSAEYLDFIVSFEKREGFESFACKSLTNIDLTLKAIHHYLLEKLKSLAIEFSVGNKYYDKHIDFTIATHPRGKEMISLNVYYLREERKFGFLIDFHFKANANEKNDRELLKLSLSLGKDGRSNKNFYSDHRHRIDKFVTSNLLDFADFYIQNASVKIASNLSELQSKSLNKKMFRFKNEQTDWNQFNGVKKYGPYEEIEDNIKYVFIFEDRFKSFANNLYFSLKGKSNPGTFSGMKQFFNLTLEGDSIYRVVLKNYNKTEVKLAIDAVIKYRDEHRANNVIAIFLEPDRFDYLSPLESPYYNLKYYLTKAEIPVQVVRDDITNNANALKWSTSNIGLQIFSKLGGTPWKLKESHSECLILGIGSALERQEDGSIKKYFAYSVCLDSSGLYKKLDVLAEESDKQAYLNALAQNLRDLLRSSEMSKYKKCALHISESVTHEAIERIQKSLLGIVNVEFKVLKINTHNKFFGYSNHNTFVPYESSYIKLAPNEYLVWFDGLVPGKENIYQKVGNPIHIKFLHSENVSRENEMAYLQDALNLSGANWRGFNARQTPISIYYAKIVADYTKAFSHFEGFDKNHLSNNLPWFL